MTRALILDMGGVCVYPVHGNWNSPVNYITVLGERAQSVFSPEFAAACREFAPILDESALVPDLRAECALRRDFYAAANRRMGWGLGDFSIGELARSATYDDTRTVFFRDALPFLEQWRGKVKLGVLSDAMPSLLEVMDHAGMLELLDFAVISTRVGAVKPDPRMFAAALEAVGVPAGDCLFVDDKPENLEGAMRAGMKAAQMLRGAHAPWQGDAVRDFAELGSLL